MSCPQLVSLSARAINKDLIVIILIVNGMKECEEFFLQTELIL